MSGDIGDLAPLIDRLAAKKVKCSARDQAALDVEEIVHSGVHGKKSLGGSGRLEALHLALSSPIKKRQHGIVTLTE